MQRFLIAIIFSVLFISCGSKETKEEPKEEQSMEEQIGHPPLMDNQQALLELAEKPPVDPDAPDVRISNVMLTKPEGWVREQPTSQLRVLQFALKQDSTAKVTGFYFGEQDMIEENITRWRKEFSEETDFDREKLADGKAVFVSISGTYQLKPFPMAQQFNDTPGYMTLAAIVETNEGPYYFKMVAPESVAKEEIKNFKKFIDSYRVEA